MYYIQISKEAAVPGLSLSDASSDNKGKLRRRRLRLFHTRSIQTLSLIHTTPITQVRRGDYNDKEIFIKSFLLLVLVSHSCSNTCIYKEMAFFFFVEKNLVRD